MRETINVVDSNREREIFFGEKPVWIEGRVWQAIDGRFYLAKWVKISWEPIAFQTWAFIGWNSNV